MLWLSESRFLSEVYHIHIYIYHIPTREVHFSSSRVNLNVLFAHDEVKLIIFNNRGDSINAEVY